MKVVRSNRGSQYYRKYDETGQQMGSFVIYLEECGIVVHHTISGIFEQNGVTERRNRALMDVKNMMSKSNLPEWLSGQSITNCNYILNGVSNKSIHKTFFEL